jgi:lysophospholipase L1-like esterase
MIRYLALGDSYTIGEGVETSSTWPSQLADRLADKGDARAIAYRLLVPEADAEAAQSPVRVDIATPADTVAAAAVDVVARTGWTADELLVALDRVHLSPPYDLVSVLIGVNDQYRDREVDEHLPYFNTLLNQAISHADGAVSRVVVVSIPDWSVSAFAAGDQRGRVAIAQAIDDYNRAQRDLCDLRGIAYVDITPLSRELGGRDDMLVGDRLHPSAAQYRAWLDMIEAAARHCLD